jgi:hypothetical protein
MAKRVVYLTASRLADTYNLSNTLHWKLDLVQTAALFVDDRGTEVSKLLNDSAVRKAVDDDAKQWNESGTNFWAVVAAPWVLVQVVT